MACILSQDEIDIMLGKTDDTPSHTERKCFIATRCVKCGSNDLSTRFYKKGDYVNGTRPFDSEGLFKSSSTTQLIDEALERVCRNCKYVWLERPLDYKGEEWRLKIW